MIPTLATTDSPNIVRWLAEAARRHPEKPAVQDPARRGGRAGLLGAGLTFRQLDEVSDEIALGLRAIGIAPRTRAVLMVGPGVELFALVFGVLKAGIVPVLIDPGIGPRNLKQCCREAEPEVFIGIPKAIAAGLVLGWGRPTVRRRIVVGDGLLGRSLPAVPLAAVVRLGREAYQRQPAGAVDFEPLAPDEPAAILFTSGSTGPPKGAVYTHRILDTQVTMIRAMFAIEPGEVDLCTFPLFALFAPALGMSAIVPEMDPTRPARANPERIVGAINAFGVTNLFGSPALLRQLVRGDGDRLERLPSLSRVVSAGAPVPARSIERMALRLLPPAQVHTVYGATEALPVASIGSDEILGETRYATDQGLGVCVGRPVGGIEVRIIRIDDGPIPEWSDDWLIPPGTVGEIVVSGPVVTREYFQRPQATRLAKILDRRREVVLHRMGDLGYLDDRGRIWFCGRKAHRVILADETLFTIPCEAIFNTHRDVHRSALVGVEAGGDRIPVICIETVRRLTRSNQDRLRDELLEHAAGFAHTRRIRTLLFHPSFPVDIRHNSKIFREKLADWAGRRVS